MRNPETRRCRIVTDLISIPAGRPSCPSSSPGRGRRPAAQPHRSALRLAMATVAPGPTGAPAPSWPPPPHRPSRHRVRPEPRGRGGHGHCADPTAPGSSTPAPPSPPHRRAGAPGVSPWPPSRRVRPTSRLHRGHRHCADPPGTGSDRPPGSIVATAAARGREPRPRRALLHVRAPTPRRTGTSNAWMSATRNHVRAPAAHPGTRTRVPSRTSTTSTPGPRAARRPAAPKRARRCRAP